MPLRRLTVHPHDALPRDRLISRQESNRQKQYSIERLGGLQTYTESVSLLRVLSVGVGTIVAPLLSVLALDVLPLQPPEAGWSKSASLWCRDFGMTFFAAFGTLLQLQAMAPSADLSIRKIARTALMTSGCYVASTALVAKLWVFPIPFMMVVSMPVWVMFLLMATGHTIGLSNLRRNAVLKTQVLRFLWLITLEANLMIIYPAYSVLFASLTGRGQIALLLLLPAIKYVIKRLMKRAVADYEDLVPAIVITVDFFNALYQSKCMQSSGSILATAGIIGIDMAQNIVSLYNLFGRVRDLEILFSADLMAKGTIAAALEIASQPSHLDERELLDIRVSSCGHFELSERHTELAERIRALQDERTLELLWRCELVLLVEYVEAAIPMLYAIYLAVLDQLPNARYYPETANMDTAHLRRAIASILIYGVLELLSLVCVHVVLKRRFKMSPLHQLAFTLESEWLLVQGAFMTWTGVLLPFTLVHHASDFTFRFEWMTAKPSR